MSLYSGPFLESSLLPWQGYTVSVIRSGLCSTGCCFTILTNLLQNMRIASRESTAIFVQSFKKLLRNTSTVAIRSVALQEFAVLAVEGKGSESIDLPSMRRRDDSDLLYRRSRSYRQDYRSPQANFFCRTTSTSQTRSEGTPDGSRGDGRVFLRAFLTPFCRFERRSLF